MAPVPSKATIWIIITAALAYPWNLIAFHTAIAANNNTLASLWLLIAYLLPMLGVFFLLAESLSKTALATPARRTAYATLMAPPLYVFDGVVSGILKSPLPERTTWIIFWLAIAILASILPGKAASQPAPTSRLRFAHGISAAILCLYIAFHLFNHLMSLFGPEVYMRVMEAGRIIYRSQLVQPVLVLILLFQIVSGLSLAWRWSRTSGNIPRTIQVASGAYLAAFLLAHMNSAFISARMVHHIDTNWAWASGGSTGLLRDAWNIRLVPHYGLGVFFILTHIACGLRAVAVSHGMQQTKANRILWTAMPLASLVSFATLAGLCGLRL